jgi:hypothetical protein
MTKIPPEDARRLQRLLLAGVMVVVVGSSIGMDAAVAVVLALAVMEIDAHFS